ncbi:MAG: WXG100 family type VII secretion target [Ruminococcus sp.]|nr:WXG100 family type VII secretion target [Ruminococcus sp.]
MANNSIRYGEGTETVVNTAAQISSLGDDFFREYTALYTLVENDLSNCWKGEDADAFKQKVNEMKHYFESMRDVITEYATFLRNTANAHDARMEDSKGQVQSNCNFD